MRIRTLFFVVPLLSLSLVDCNKRVTPAETVSLAMDRVAPSPAGTHQVVLQKSFPIKSVSYFPFEIPAHAARPHLHGTFESYSGKGATDEGDVDFLIVNEEQYDDMRANRPGETLMSAEASHNQDVDFYLPPSMAGPVKYYLVFRNSSPTGSRVVKADFEVDF